MVGKYEARLHWVYPWRDFEEHEHVLESVLVFDVGPDLLEGDVLVDELFDDLYISDLELIQIVLFVLLMLGPLLLLLLIVLLLVLLLLVIIVLLLVLVSLSLIPFSFSKFIYEVHKESYFMIRYDRQVFYNLGPVVLVNVQAAVIRNDDEIRIEWTDLLENYCLK